MEKSKHIIPLMSFLAVISFSAIASAESIGPFSSNVARFSSDLETDKTVSVAAFDLGSDYQLDSVTVDIKYSASVDMKADNDDSDDTAAVNARMIRSFTVSGPGVFQLGSKTVSSGIVDLTVDDGDLTLVDPTPADGTDFGGSLSYSNLLAGSVSPAINGYIGTGMIDFTVDVLTMVNDLQFHGGAPDVWQMEVENPSLDVWVDVTYDYHAVPEPISLSLLALGGLVVIRRRR